MLKGIDPIIHAELLHVLMLMGHGDDLVVCDINHPAATIAAKTTYGSLINLSGCGLAEATRAILTLFPLDTFVDKPVCRMEVVGDPERQMPIFAQIQGVIDAAEGRPVPMQPLERFCLLRSRQQVLRDCENLRPGPIRLLHSQEGRDLNPAFGPFKSAAQISRSNRAAA